MLSRIPSPPRLFVTMLFEIEPPLVPIVTLVPSTVIPSALLPLTLKLSTVRAFVGTTPAKLAATETGSGRQESKAWLSVTVRPMIV